ncbi:MAG TPA: HAD family hydrolase [Anaerolineaceae bacterium]
MAVNKYLVWDFEGTLAWRPSGWTGAVIKVLRKRAPEMTVSADQVRPYLQSGFPWQAPENPHPGLDSNDWWEDMQPVFIRALRGVGIENGQAVAFARDIKTAYLDPTGWQRYNDTLTALELLAARGWKHVLLSNHVPELPLLLDRMGLSAYFTAVFNSAQTGYEKPNPKAFRNVVEWAGPGASLWVIGDSYPADILGAQEANLPAILVRKPHPDAPIFCATLPEISEYL